MNRATWKNAEREIAARLGGVRVPVTGRQRGDAPDIAHATLALEVKARSALPALITGAMAQAKACAKGAQAPCVVLHQAGARYDDSIVCMRLADFAALMEKCP